MNEEELLNQLPKLEDSDYPEHTDEHTDAKGEKYITGECFACGFEQCLEKVKSILENH